MLDVSVTNRVKVLSLHLFIEFGATFNPFSLRLSFESMWTMTGTTKVLMLVPHLFEDYQDPNSSKLKRKKKERGNKRERVLIHVTSYCSTPSYKI